MLVREAKDTASRWVESNASSLPGFVGAILSGSVIRSSDDSDLPTTSDVDVNVILDDADAARSPGKLLFGGVILDVSYLDSDLFRSAERVLGDYRLAHTVAAGGILSDPAKELVTLHEAVAREYAETRWIEVRCDHACENSTRFLDSLDDSDELHDRVTSWLFGTGVTTHVLLVAGLENPTVRRRYATVRELLIEHDLPHFHEDSLELLGCADMSRSRTEHHLKSLEGAFDAASESGRTTFFFDSDISALGRAIAIDGSREMIEAGLHREAVFWICATFSRCRKILRHDSTAGTFEPFEPGYRELLSDLGISSDSDLQRRCEVTRRFLPQVRRVAEEIIAPDPGSTDRPTRRSHQRKSP